MALVDDLVAQIGDRALRQRLDAALTDLKHKSRFGLVFEEHIPETVALTGLPVQVGLLVQRRNDLSAKVLYRVIELNADGRASIEALQDGARTALPVADLLPVKR